MRIRHRLAPTLLTLSLCWTPACSDDDDDGPDAGAQDASTVTYPDTPYEAVDLTLGTGGDGFGVGSGYPGASRPFSMVKLSPDTSAPNGSQVQWSHCAGYADTDPMILGFSHTHMNGVGIPGYGNLRLMPVVGWDATLAESKAARIRYDKASERAEPGYYTVTLDDGIQAELTVGEHTGYHRYTWPADTADGDAVVTFDLAATINNGRPIAGEVTIDATAGRIHGYTYIDDQLGSDFLIYFDAQLDRPILDHGVWADGELSADATADGTAVGAWVALEPDATGAANLRVAISWVDPAGALANREHDEAAAADFDAARAAARATWENTLGKIEVTGGTAVDQRLLYSALYKVYLTPTHLTDADGRYHGLDHAVHQGTRPYYSDFSLWDTYRTLHPLLILLEPGVSADMAQSLVTMADEWGGIPKWPMGTVETGTMIGSPADMFLVGSYLKGVTDFDLDTAWTHMYARATGPVSHAGRGSIQEYLDLGYVPSDREGGAVSKTEEYNWADFALANLAEARGQTAEAATLRAQSRSMTALWDDSVGYFRGRYADGTWDPSFSEEAWEDYFTEGNAWQHLWLTPYPDLLAEVMGGRDAVVAKLDDFFRLSREDWEWSGLGYWAPLPFYWHGNEPDIHAPYMYAALGRPAGTQRWVQWVRDIHYDLGPKGLAGNDDAGTLTAWYVFSSLGFYPWAGSDLYIVGTPAFERAVVHLAGGDLIIEATGLGDGPYVQSLTLDGAPLEVPWFRHDDIAAGATLSFVLGAEPSEWGVTDEWPL